METQGGGGDALGSGAVVSAQQEQQQLVPDAYMVPETAVREGNVSSMKRRMQSGGPAQPQVGSMTMQVTQTRRTIFPGATGNSIMRAVGHDVQYQHPGEMLQLHTYCTYFPTLWKHVSCRLVASYLARVSLCMTLSCCCCCCT